MNWQEVPLLSRRELLLFLGQLHAKFFLLLQHLFSADLSPTLSYFISLLFLKSLDFTHDLVVEFHAGLSLFIYRSWSIRRHWGGYW